MFKKVFLAVLAIVGSISIANAQEVFQKGTTAINAGVGLGSYYSGLAIPPLSVSLDYGVTGNMINGNNGSISVGGFLGYTATKKFYGDAGASIAVLGARGAFHYQFAPKLDTYAGLMLGYNYVNWKTGYDASFYSYDSFGYNVFIGARYFFTDKIAELGYGISYTTLGATFRL